MRNLYHALAVGRSTDSFRRGGTKSMDVSNFIPRTMPTVTALCCLLLVSGCSGNGAPSTSSGDAAASELATVATPSTLKNLGLSAQCSLTVSKASLDLTNTRPFGLTMDDLTIAFFNSHDQQIGTSQLSNTPVMIAGSHSASFSGDSDNPGFLFDPVPSSAVACYPISGDVEYQGSSYTVSWTGPTQSQIDGAVAERGVEQSAASSSKAAQQSSRAAQVSSEDSQCTSAGGTIGADTGGPLCTVDGVQDPLTSNGTFSFPPAAVVKAVTACSGVGGHFLNDPTGGYGATGNGSACVMGDTQSVWTYGFEDNVVSFDPVGYLIPLDEASTMNNLETECVSASGDFGLDLNTTGNVFSCFINGTTYVDISMTPKPHYVSRLS